MSWDKHISDGVAAVQVSDFSAAERCFQQALNIANQTFSDGDSRLPVTLSLLGHMYFKTHDFAQGEQFLEQALQLHWRAKTIDDVCILMDLFTLGEIKISNKKRVEACRLYEQAMSKLKPMLPSNSSAVERLQKLLDNNVAQLTYTEKLELKQPALLSYLTETKKVRQQTKDNVAEIVVEAAAEELVAEPTQSHGIDSGAEELWRKQLSKGLEALAAEEQERESVVQGYLNLESALRLARRLFPAGDKRLTSSLKGLADASSSMKMFEQSEALYREAIASAKADSAGQMQVCILRLNLAIFYTQFDQFRQAKKIFADVKIPTGLEDCEGGKGLTARVERACHSIAIYESVQNLIRQAQSAESAGDLEKAAKTVNTAMTNLRQAFAPNHPEHASLLRYRLQLLKKLGQTTQAVELEQRAERIEKANETTAAELEKISEELPKPQLGISV